MVHGRTELDLWRRHLGGYHDDGSKCESQLIHLTEVLM